MEAATPVRQTKQQTAVHVALLAQSARMLQGRLCSLLLSCLAPMMMMMRRNIRNWPPQRRRYQAEHTASLRNGLVNPWLMATHQTLMKRLVHEHAMQQSPRLSTGTTSLATGDM